LPTELRLALAFALAGLATFAVTPLARRLALATDFLDEPRGYKVHGEPTPYLGGAAVLAGFGVAALTLAVTGSDLWPVLVGAVLLWAVGTLDDRIGLGALSRVFAAAAVATGLWAMGLGWDVLGVGAADLALTVLWVVALVNAFNLFDNLDGAASSLGAVVAAGVALVAGAEGQDHVAALALALSGACAGFLPYNLSRPRATIFLGDGGSMLIGFVVAAVTMSLQLEEAGGISPALVALVLAGVAVADTLLVIVSRVRRRVSILTAGRDHLTHRLLARLGSPRKVVVAVVAAQAALSVLALGAARAGETAVAILTGAYLLALAATIVVLEREAASAVPQRSEPRSLQVAATAPTNRPS
jgi:UDP-GlcNAc:undecaprenyl-phosphate GlcNAc-1-phosphate transferase